MAYLPEGRLLHTAENQAICASLDALDQARRQETIVEGRAVLCTPDHDLVVRVGPFSGRIPREEAALGIREGRTREIAILSRVGKPISFTVTEIQGEDEPSPLLLSRRRAQELTVQQLRRRPPGTILPATVTHLEGFGAFVDVGCGVVSMIGIENISVSRIQHPRCRFTPGQEIFALLTGSDGEKFNLSHKELLGTWQENAASFSPGMTVPGVVRSCQSYGTFVELTPNLTGLADPSSAYSPGEQVSVYIRSILSESMKVKLTILESLGQEERPAPLVYWHTDGRMTAWNYSPPDCPRVIRRVYGDSCGVLL